MTQLKLEFSFSVGSSGALNGSTVIGENTGVFVGGLPRGHAMLRNDVGEFAMGIEGICCHPNIEEPHGTFFSSLNHSGISCLMLCVLYQYVKHFF